MSYQWMALILVGALCTIGCEKRAAPLPQTYPVRGKVVFEDGTPLTSGMVQFQPDSESSVITNGNIQNDGTFELRTIRDGLRAPGAVAGANRVTVTSMGDGQRGMVMYTFPDRFVVEQRDNEFTLKIKGH